jgi:nucleotide-binding universal stress UspA family protein
MSNAPRILIAIDFTTRPDGVCRTAADLAARLGAEVTLLNVVVMPAGVPEQALVQVEGREDPAPARNLLQQDAVEHVRPLLEHFSAAGVAAEISCRRGEVVPTIIACADEIDALFIVTGSDVPTGLQRLFKAGFTASVIRASSCPVLVVPPSADEDVQGRSAAQAQVDAEVDG